MEYIIEFEEKLQNQVIPQNMNEDFPAFWHSQVNSLREIPLQIKREKYSTPYERTFITYKLSYNTHDATWIDAYFSVPTGAAGKLPCVVFYHGGRGKKSLTHAILSTGVCCLAMDVRGQGGTSIDKAFYTTGDVNGGLMSCGITDKNNFYMRNIYLDAVRAMDVAATLPEVDPERIVTYGGSQGGALSVVASALSGRSKKCYCGISSYCCLKQRTELGSGILSGAHEYLRNYPEDTDLVMDTLSYFDINNMVSLLNVPTRFCMGLNDPICLPKFVYSAYYHASCEKQMDMYPFVQHTIPTDWMMKVHVELAAL